jgi:hypothetical protein
MVQPVDNLSTFFSLPMDAQGPQNDPVVGQDEFGRLIYQGQNGSRYVMTERPRMDMSNALAYAVDNPWETAKGVAGAIVEGAWNGVSAPGNALRGETLTYGDVADTALDWGVFSAAGTAPQGAIRAGAMRSADDATRPLYAIHNTNADRLRFADDLGGMPMPSIAGVAEDAPMTRFGDITLVGDRSMMMPSRSNRVYYGDAYTMRQPRGMQVFTDDSAARRALSQDPRFSHMRDASWFWDSFDDLGRADDAWRQIEAGIAGGLNPADFDSLDDLRYAARRAVPYSEDLTQYSGIQQFGGTEWVLPQGFTPSGNQRRPRPYTLDNVMREMRGASQNASEGFNYGPSSFRAASARPLSNFSDVDARRFDLISEEATQTAYDGFSEQYYDVLGRLGAGDDFGAMDRAAEYMSDLVSGRGREWSGVDWVDNMAPETRQEILGLAENARNLPNQYFEAKPNRAVGLDEWSAAIVPENANVDDVLSRNDINQVLRYTSPEQRAQMLSNLRDLSFGVAAGGMMLPFVSEEDNALSRLEAYLNQ